MREMHTGEGAGTDPRPSQVKGEESQLSAGSTTTPELAHPCVLSGLQCLWLSHLGRCIALSRAAAIRLLC